MGTRKAIKNGLSDANSSTLFQMMEKNREKAKAGERITLKTQGSIDRKEMKLAKEFLGKKENAGERIKKENARTVFRENMTMFSQRKEPKKTNPNQGEKPTKAKRNTTTSIDGAKLDRAKGRAALKNWVPQKRAYYSMS